MTLAEQQYDNDKVYASLEQHTRGKVCRVSGKRPVLVRHQEAWVATCADHRPNPCLWKKDDSQKERYGAMVNHAMAVRPEQMPMSVNEIKQFISPMATEAEAYIFLRFCQAQGLNPFINDAYLIKYDPKGKAAIVIGIQALLKRAESNPNYTGYQTGVVVLRDGEPVELQGSLVYKDSDVLIGGWAEVRRKDWPKAVKITVALKEYNKRQAQWTEKPATMIEKVALAQGLRRVFPQEVGTLFERQELETEVGEVEGITVTVPEPAQDTQPAPEAQAARGEPVEPSTASGYAEHQVRQATENIARPAGNDITSREWQSFYDWCAEKYGIEKPADIHMILGKSAAKWTGTLRDAAALIQAAKAEAAKIR